VDNVGLAAIILYLRRHPRDDTGRVQHLPKQHCAGSPVNLSARVSIVRERLNPVATGRSVSPMRASVAAADFVSTA